MAVADFVARKSDGRVVLAVEVRNKRDTTGEWATQVRRNLLAHVALDAPYFLLVTPDRIYFWLNGTAAKEVPPSAEMDARELLLPYIRTAGIRDEHLSTTTFEFVVSSWLRELLSKPPSGAAARYPSSLFASGFFDAVRDSQLNYQPER
jgi:hypothetical protein